MLIVIQYNDMRYDVENPSGHWGIPTHRPHPGDTNVHRVDWFHSKFCTGVAYD